MYRPVRFCGVTWVAVPRMLVARLVVGAILLLGALVLVVAIVVLSFRTTPAPWYFYPLFALGLAVWLAFAVSTGAAGVFVRQDGVVVVNPFHVSSLRWDEIERFSLDESLRSIGLTIGLVHRRAGGSTMLWGIRPLVYGLWPMPWDSWAKRQGEEAISFLNKTLTAHTKPT
jgi:hypothetical protein